MAKMTIDELVAQLRAAHGGALCAVVLYGSAAGGEHHASSDQNVLVVVRALSLDALGAAGSVARAWREAGNPVPLTLTDAEWRSSVDIFAMEHADILQRNRVLWAEPGYLPMDGVRVAPAHVRHQLEYEAMGMLLRLRGGILEAGNDGKKRMALLATSAGQVFVLFRALLRSIGEVPPDDNEALCRIAAAKAQFDPEPFVAVVAHRRGTAKLEKARAAGVLAGYHSGLERLVAYLDSLPIAGGSS